MIRVLIVDDEKEAREGLESLLEGNVEIVAACKNGIEAIDALQQHKIDLMFLDIQMPGVDGFDVLRSVPPERTPVVIFTTAYDQYALKAFDVHAVDYLLKPFSDSRFHEALALGIEKVAGKQQKDRTGLEKLLSNAPSSEVDQTISKDRLVIKDSGKIHFIPLSAITWVEAYDYYVKIHTRERFFLQRKSLKKMQSMLPENFIRVHKSSIINVDYVVSIQRSSKGEMLIDLGSEEGVRVSRSYRDVVENLLT